MILFFKRMRFIIKKRFVFSSNLFNPLNVTAMTIKKSEQVNLESKSNFFVLLGLIMALSTVYIAFEWSKDVVIYDNLVQNKTDFEGDVFIPPTVQPETPPPPAPPVPVVIENIHIVDHEVPSVDFDIPEDDATYTVLAQVPQAVPVPEVEDEIHTWVAEMPIFNGDVNAYLSKAINYPIIAVETGTQGRVYCEFVVNVDGSIVDIKVIRGVDRSLDNEALRVVKLMPKWKPGRINGKAVRVKYTLPISFKLM